MQRIFVPARQIKNGSVEISGSDINHLKNVLRLGVGGRLIVCDGASNSYLAEINSLSKEKIVAKIEETIQEESEPKIKITLAQSIPKASKMDLIIQKCVELGVSEIIPTLSERSIPKLDKKNERWQKIAKAAAEQSGRSIIPQIKPSTPFSEILKLAKKFDLALIPWEMEKDNSLKTVIRNRVFKNILVLIGPEGGFSLREVEEAKAAGFISVSLGKRILRAETAPIAVLANLFYELES